jgi:two-component system sensor histidine kinase BaeS
MRIFPKLLLVFLLTSFALLLILYALMQWGLDRGMLNYVNQRQVQSLQLVADNLAAVYQEQEGWQAIVASSAKPRERSLNKPTRRTGINDPLRRPPPRGENSKRANRLARASSLAAQQNYSGVEYWRIVLRLSEQGLRYPDDIEQLRGDYAPRYQRKARFNHTSPEPRQKNLQVRAKFSLLTVDKQALIGLYAENFVKKSILSNGEIVGYVALPPTEQITDKFDLQFVEDINQQILLILAGIFIVIIIITIPLSRHFVGPITRLKHAVIKVNQGELSIRLPITGRDELATLARNFNDLAATLEQNETSRKRWLADISHELRTPLAIVKGELEAMEDGVRPLNIDSIRSISEEVNHLQSLISDLNELNQAEIGAMRYQKSVLNIGKLLTLNAERHRSLLQSQGLTLVLDIPDKVLSCWADAKRLNQLLDNLFVNSAKYTDAPGQVYCRLVDKHDDIDIYLEDSTPGVSAEDMTKLFEHLYRVESSRNRKTGGSGIGLALCKNIVYAHQGTISAHQAKSGGLMIKITLPKH